ncbi:hypothetical protein PR048_033152 [Dryococelus australis]|uniref:Endonuclease/exonuclease/phosphatase domain-containing protein n=1 Tax=Dryococelus australis TaxID=614101 RepID=A0ABQ9G2K5_9NEOP|nr:hypothetical protein PR048_033152 [Dryococelus australis]
MPGTSLCERDLVCKFCNVISADGKCRQHCEAVYLSAECVGDTGELSNSPSPQCSDKYVCDHCGISYEVKRNHFVIKDLLVGRFDPKSLKTHKLLMEYLIANTFEPYTYSASGQSSQARIIFRNLPKDTHPEDIAEDLRRQGFTNPKVKILGDPKIERSPFYSPRVLVILPDNKDETKLLSTNQILHYRTETYTSYTPKRCQKCQCYGHVASNCYRTPKCPQCSENHQAIAQFVETHTHTVGGGVALLIKNKIHFHIKPHQIYDITEAVAIQIQDNSGLITIAAVYIKPGFRIPTADLEALRTFDQCIILMGDFNAAHPSWNNPTTNSHGIQLPRFLSNKPLIIQAPISCTHHSERYDHYSIIDFFITSPDITITNIQVSYTGTSDHYPVKVEVLARHFEATYRQPALPYSLSPPPSDSEDDHDQAPPVTLPPRDNLPDTKLTTPSEIFYLLTKTLKTSSAPGEDSIPNAVLIHLPQKAIIYLTCIINSIIINSYFPTCWKNAIIVPIPKPGKPTDKPSSYRPIALLPSLSKILEKIILQ